MAQSYGLRLSFMTYVRERFGLAKMIALSYVDEPLTEDMIEHALGSSIDDLAVAWKTWARTRIDAEEHAPEQMESYRTMTPIRYFPKCTPDVAKSL